MKTDELRQDARASLSVKIRYKSATVDEFIERYSGDISRGGVFVHTQDPLAVGTLIKLEFRLADDSPLVEGVGRVIWKRTEQEAQEDLPAGMGLRFIKMDAESRALVDRIAAHGGASASAFFDPDADNKTTIRDAGGLMDSVVIQTADDATVARELKEDAKRVRRASMELEARKLREAAPHVSEPDVTSVADIPASIQRLARRSDIPDAEVDASSTAPADAPSDSIEEGLPRSLRPRRSRLVGVALVLGVLCVIAALVWGELGSGGFGNEMGTTDLPMAEGKPFPPSPEPLLRRGSEGQAETSASVALAKEAEPKAQVAVEPAPKSPSEVEAKIPSETSPPAETVAPPAPSAPAPSEGVSPEAAADSPEGSDAFGAAPVAMDFAFVPYVIEITTEPAGARVASGSQVLAKAPGQLLYDSWPEERWLVVTSAGYEPARRRLVPDDFILENDRRILRLNVTLEPIIAGSETDTAPSEDSPPDQPAIP